MGQGKANGGSSDYQEHVSSPCYALSSFQLQYFECGFCLMWTLFVISLKNLSTSWYATEDPDT
jgi:hypothetical protein